MHKAFGTCNVTDHLDHTIKDSSQTACKVRIIAWRYEAVCVTRLKKKTLQAYIEFHWLVSLSQLLQQQPAFSRFVCIRKIDSKYLQRIPTKNHQEAKSVPTDSKKPSPVSFPPVLALFGVRCNQVSMARPGKILRLYRSFCHPSWKPFERISKEFVFSSSLVPFSKFWAVEWHHCHQHPLRAWWNLCMHPHQHFSQRLSVR